MNRTVAIIIVSLGFTPCFTQTDQDKNYRLYYTASIDLSVNMYRVSSVYYTRVHPPVLPEQLTITATWKPAFGEGLRCEIRPQHRISCAFSCMALDKGYSYKYESTRTESWLNKIRNKYGMVYLSIPVEMLFKLSPKTRPAYIKTGSSCDLKFRESSNYRPVSVSFLLGGGRSFLINEVLLLKLEPTLRYGLHDYAEQIRIIPNHRHDYRPFSIGITFCLLQVNQPLMKQEENAGISALSLWKNH